jgi:murein hydrolase activator
MRIDLKWLSGLLLMLIVIGMTVQVAPAARGVDLGFIRVMDLTLRSGPDQATRPIKTLARGAVVTVLGRKNGWLKISHEGHTGYILNKADYVRLLPANEVSSTDEVSSTNEVPSVDGGSSTDAAASTDAADSEEAVAQAEQPDSQRRDRLETQLKTSTAHLAAIQEKETSLLDAVDQAEKQVNRKRQQVLATEKDLGALEEQIQVEKAQLEDLEANLAVNSAYAGRRVRALHQLNTLGTLPVLANAESWMDFLKRKAALSMVIEADRRLLDHLAADRRQQTTLLASLQQRRDERRQLEKKLRQELADLTARLDARTELLVQIQGEASLQADLVKGLMASAEALETTISQLTVPEAELGPQASRVSAGDSAEAGRPQNNQPPFIKLKGLLNLPVNGKIISSYGRHRDAEFDVMSFRSGVLIRADRGEPIHAVANGTTLFADWFKGYGNMLIIDHGDHYYTVYAHLEALFKARGDPVDADEVIATVGETATPAGPGLHFEVRHYGKPVDPLAWLRTTDTAASDRKKGVKG